ncbi:MAG: exodeoxyribonuclease VII large subunit [Verrucomicrobia bacterium]|nr:exodeoxyribonuclease VII large subunit [Verrucomicrobiota bacterium]
MPRRTQSPWNFDGLFPPEAGRQVLTVSALTSRIRSLLEQHLGQVWVSGEITNRRAQSSGHIYFTLKDAFAQLNCVLFRNEPVPHRDLLDDGRNVILQGELTVYEPRGQYQLIVHRAEMEGVGALQLAFERLKRKLQAEGLFDPARKRPLPRCPRRIGLVTSPTGAALRDVLHVVRRRNPALDIVLAPCRVQGEGAAAEIAAALDLLNAWHAAAGPTPPAALDAILLTRGGGSLEDLWAFNEETVARAIARSAVPVVSAIGHEIDFTISDFVADLRAATPSAAAELLTEGVFARRQFVAETAVRLPQLARQRWTQFRDDTLRLGRRLARVHPRRRLRDQVQRVDELQAALRRAARQRRRELHTAWTHLRQRLARLRPSAPLAQRRQLLLKLHHRFREQCRHQLATLQHRHAQLAHRLRLLSPDNVLRRGYSITTDAASGRVLRDARTVRPGQPLDTRLHHGQVRSIATQTPAPP